MAKAHFTVDSKNKVIFANVEKLTDKELNTVKKYITLGYELKETETVKKETPDFSRDSVIKFLEENGTPEQIATFNRIMDEPIKSGAVYAKDVYERETYIGADGETHTRDKKDKDGNKIISHRAGEPKTKGYIASLKYFKEQFPLYPNK
jgi:hypothetical protein